MPKYLMFIALWLLYIDANAALGGGDAIDFTPIPSEFCNQESNRKHKALFDKYPKDIGIAKIYSLYIGLCQLVTNGDLTEYAAQEEWMHEREKLIESRK